MPFLVNAGILRHLLVFVLVSFFFSKCITEKACAKGIFLLPGLSALGCFSEGANCSGYTVDILSAKEKLWQLS